MIKVLRNTLFVVKILQLVFFLFYICSISFFTHTHVINGIAIAHSHLYKQTKNADSNESSGHKHSIPQIELISVLSHFSASGDFSVSKIEPHYSSYNIVYFNIPDFLYSSEYSANFYLRGPPSYVA